MYLKRTLGREAHIDQCGNRRGLVLHSCILSSIVDITNRLVLLTSLIPRRKKLDEYSCLSIPLSNEGEEVYFG